ncbi:MAG: hypothetical protein K6F34_09490 [Lachnospiraceae bacterium]|nr:hypothetical protein [Lachnospiraceae bacterium]
MSSSMVICDRDSEYGSRLADRIRRSECGYEVILFTDPEKFEEYRSDDPFRIMLRDEGFFAEGPVREGSCKCFILTTDRDKAMTEGYIFKYQPVSEIFMSMGEGLSVSPDITRISGNDEGSRIIGIYSPVSHALKTTYAMALTRMLSDDVKALYVNMEGYNGLLKLLNADPGFSLQDLVYEYSLRPGELDLILQRYVYDADGMQMLLPARCPYELNEVDPSVWPELIRGLAMSGRFGFIILDLSDEVRGMMELMNMCSVIYMPVRRDAVSVAKLKDFDEALIRYPGGEGIRSRIIRLKFPYFEDMERAVFGRGSGMLNKYIRNEILKGLDEGYDRDTGCE